MKKSLLFVGIAILVLLMAVFIIWKYVSLPSTYSEQSDIGASETTPSVTKNSEQSLVPFEHIVRLGPGSLPLRSQHAVTEWQGSPITVFTDQSVIYVAEQDGTRHQVTTLERTSGGPTIASSNDRAVVAWVTPTAIMASSSTDLKSWTSPIIVGVREENGGPIPSADWTGSEFAVVWVDAPKINETTGGMDGVGALRVATSDGIGAWKVSTINSTTAIVAIAGSTIVWRDDRGISGSRVDSIRTANINGKDEQTLTSGYDPAIAVDGNAIAIGYHVGSAAHLLTSIDGKTWNDETLDSSGKFVAPLVSDEIFGAVWVDYTDAQAAKDARNSAGHRTTAVWDGTTYKMNEGKTYTLQGQGTTIAGTPVVVYQVDGEIYLSY
ncbi:MAG: hypothetical protein AAB839_01005 [Patescibacteria group bacterium]